MRQCCYLHSNMHSQVLEIVSAIRGEDANELATKVLENTKRVFF